MVHVQRWRIRTRLIWSITCRIREIQLGCNTRTHRYLSFVRLVKMLILEEAICADGRKETKLVWYFRRISWLGKPCALLKSETKTESVLFNTQQVRRKEKQFTFQVKSPYQNIQLCYLLGRILEKKVAPIIVGHVPVWRLLGSNLLRSKLYSSVIKIREFLQGSGKPQDHFNKQWDKPAQ